MAAMFFVKWGLIGLIALPAAELAAFVLVAAVFGWLKATMLLLATSLAGLALLRRSGRAHLAQLRQAVAQDGIGAVDLESPAFAAVLGGILLLVPGFITDVLGAALFVPVARRWFARKLSTLARADRRRREGHVIDLEPNEWRRLDAGRERRWADGQGRRPRRQ